MILTLAIRDTPQTACTESARVDEAGAREGDPAFLRQRQEVRNWRNRRTATARRAVDGRVREDRISMIAS